jgi:hypothetical protein
VSVILSFSLFVYYFAFMSLSFGVNAQCLLCFIYILFSFVVCRHPLYPFPRHILITLPVTSISVRILAYNIVSFYSQMVATADWDRSGCCKRSIRNVMLGRTSHFFLPSHIHMINQSLFFSELKPRHASILAQNESMIRCLAPADLAADIF